MANTNFFGSQLSWPGRANNPSHQVDDVINLEGLANEPCVARALVTNRRFRRRTHQEDRNVPEVWVIGHGFYELRAVRDGHHEMGDYQVRALFYGALERFV